TFIVVFNLLLRSRPQFSLSFSAAIVQQSPPSLISMAGGMPNVNTFPLVEGSFKLKDGTEIVIDKKSMKQALQYSATQGIPELLSFVYKLQFRIHDPPTYNNINHPGQMECIITNGSQDGLCKVFEAITNEGDNILLEHPCYSGTLAIARPLTKNIIPVRSDMDGLDPDHLEEILSKWSPSDVKDPESSIPKFLYCIPNGGNPTGSGLTLERKKRIYDIARKYDLLILEDDPYFFIQFNKPYVPSLLSMDEDGRVIRFDSFSKLLSSGMRVGFVSGPRPIIDRVALHMQCSGMHTSGMSQVTLSKILEHWGHDGFLKHAEKTSEFYLKRRESCLAAAEKHLKGLAEWTIPSGGMFLWIKLNIEDTFQLITVKARAKNILFVPGNAFLINEDESCPYIRASYSSCTEEEMDVVRLPLFIGLQRNSIETMSLCLYVHLSVHDVK
ncbi:hypothetical protein FSP39_022850, partial [Pinctada imbricata]